MLPEPDSVNDRANIDAYPGTLQGLMMMIKDVDASRGGEHGRCNPMPDSLRNAEEALAIILKNNRFTPNNKTYLEKRHLTMLSVVSFGIAVGFPVWGNLPHRFLGTAHRSIRVRRVALQACAGRQTETPWAL